MTHELLKQALEALSRPRPQNSFYQRACDDADVAKAIRAYLYEQPMQVAHRITAMQALEALDELESSARGDEPFNHAAAPVVRSFIEGTLLSAAPQAQPERKPMTAEQITRLLDRVRMQWVSSPPTYEAAPAFVRAVEAHHGIGEKT